MHGIAKECVNKRESILNEILFHIPFQMCISWNSSFAYIYINIVCGNLRNDPGVSPIPSTD